jgi:hypothetical protein
VTQPIVPAVKEGCKIQLEVQKKISYMDIQSWFLADLTGAASRSLDAP